MKSGLVGELHHRWDCKRHFFDNKVLFSQEWITKLVKQLNHGRVQKLPLRKISEKGQKNFVNFFKIAKIVPNL